jgi:hypothetical protein
VKWLPALVLGAILGITLPLALGGQDGIWMQSWVKWGTIRPVAGSPGLLFSIPLALGSAIALRIILNWHRN